MEEKDGITISGRAAGIIVLAVLSGLGNLVAGLSKGAADTGDRYHGSTAKSDWAHQDQRDFGQDGKIGALESSQHAHQVHAATYTQIIVQLKKDFDNHMRKYHER